MRAPDGVFIALLLVVMGIAAVLALGADDAEGLYVPGDWIVNTTQQWDDETITVRGNVHIQDGGVLTLRNCTVEMDSRRGDRFRFRVEDDGLLHAFDTTFRSRTQNNNDERYFFDALNDVVLVNCDISRLYGWNGQNPGGIRLLGGEHVIRGCYIHDSRTYGIYTRCPIQLEDTTIRWTGWSRFQISTSGRLFDMDFIVDNCTFVGNANDPYSTGVNAGDGYSGDSGRYLNVTNCHFEGLTYGVYKNADWDGGLCEISENTFDRCTYGIRAYTNQMDTFIHHNRYFVRGGGYGLRIYEGSYGNISWVHEDIRGANVGSGSGCYLEGAGRGVHLVKDVSIWNTFYGIRQVHGHCTVVDSYVNTTNLQFYVNYGATTDIYNTEHKVGSGFVDNWGGRITGWQRVNISKVSWSDGTPITDGTVHLLNETDVLIGEVNLTRGPRSLDFKRWEVKRGYTWTNIHIFPALLDVDTYFRAEELDYLETAPQEVVFTDDFVPLLDMPGVQDGHTVNVSYLILEGPVVERGRGLATVEVSLDGESWRVASITGEEWDIAFSSVPDAMYDIRVRARDKAGNVGELVREGVIVDTEAPAIDLEEEPPLATNQALLTLVGRTEPGAELFMGDVLSFPDADGAFVLEFPLDEGVNGLVLKVRDVAGNWNQRVWSVLLDTTAPPLTLREPPDGLMTNHPMVTFSGVTEADATVTVDGERVGTYKGAFTTDLNLTEGEHEVTVEASDMAGNTAIAVRGVTVDLTPPVLEVERPLDAHSITTDETAYIAGITDPEIDHVFINGENVSALPGEFAVQVDLVEGENAFNIVVRDLAGNERRTTVAIVRDTKPPKYYIEVEAKDGEILRSGDDKLTKSGTLVFHVQVDEHAVFTMGAEEHEGEGQFDFEHNLTDGSNTINMEIADTMGNHAEAFVYVIIHDDTPPTVTITFPSDGTETSSSELLLKGVCDDPRATVRVNDIPVGVGADGTFEMTVALDMGDNAYTARARDRAGNEGTTTLTVVRKEESTVQESDVGPIAMGLVVGLVIGVLLMYMLARRSAVAREMERGPARPPGRTPPPTPPSPPGGGTGEPPGGWEEY